MRRFLALLLVLGLGLSSLPPATCTGLGRSCCCASSAGDQVVPVAQGEPRFDRGCPCGCPELGPADAAPRMPAPARAEAPVPAAAIAMLRTLPPDLGTPDQVPAVAPERPHAIPPPLRTPLRI